MFKGAASTQADCLLKSLRDQKEEVENQNKDMKAKLLAKQKAKECQKSIIESFMSCVLKNQKTIQLVNFAI